MPLSGTGAEADGPTPDPTEETPDDRVGHSEENGLERQSHQEVDNGDVPDPWAD